MFPKTYNYTENKIKPYDLFVIYQLAYETIQSKTLYIKTLLNPNRLQNEADPSLNSAIINKIIVNAKLLKIFYKKNKTQREKESYKTSANLSPTWTPIP